MEEAQRLLKLPTYVFALLDKLKTEERAKGKDLIDLSIGSPNLPPPPGVIEAMIEALREPSNHRYASFEGNPEFNEAVAAWCKRQYGIEIDAHKEVVALIGSKEGLIHLSFAFLNPGDTILVPLPAYPAHFRGPILAGANLHILPTIERTGFVPNLKNIDETIARRAKMLIISHPTNPTAATVPKEFFEEAVKFAKKYELILVHDFAYAELYFENQKLPSCLSISGAKDIGIEFHTLSKTFGMAGWRVGFAVGNAQVIETLRKIKTNIDYGLFPAAQKAAVTALKLKDGYLEEMRLTYQKRRDLMVEGLNSLGWKLKKPRATFYLWVPTPKGFNSTSFTNYLIQKTGVVVSPGVAFGELGEGYIRISLVDTEVRLKEALDRIKKAGIRYNG